MNTQKTIRQLLGEKDNNYSEYESFSDSSPIPSSIIIPVCNGAEVFKKTLENISQQRVISTNPNLFEIIIVDDGSNEDIRSVFEASCFECAKYLIRHNKNLGRSAARNSGIKKANKKLFFFFDADILLPSNYFERMWAIHNSLDNAVAIGLAQNVYFDNISSQVTNPDKITPDVTDDFRYYKKFEDLRFGRAEFKLMKETGWLKQFGYHRKIGPWTLPKMVVTHNVSVRREHSLRVKGFDERFKTWGYEDTHFGAKLIAAGCYVIPSKELGVIRMLQGDKKRKFSDENRQLYERLIDLPLD